MLHKVKKNHIKPRSQSARHGTDIDIAALKANLNRSYAQRIRRHQLALDKLHELQKTGLIKSPNNSQAQAALISLFRVDELIAYSQISNPA